jgi:hypothetical protein
VPDVNPVPVRVKFAPLQPDAADILAVPALGVPEHAEGGAVMLRLVKEVHVGAAQVSNIK